MMDDSTLNADTVKNIATKVKLPEYRPSEHNASIVHIGIGAFHKAHQAVYTDDLLNQVGGDWRIVAVSLRSATARDQLVDQNYLYTVNEKQGTHDSVRVIGAIKEVLVAPENPQAVIQQLADPMIKVVTCTITEKGYCLTPDNHHLDRAHPDIQHDLQDIVNPKTMAGYVVAACQLRRQNGLSGFTFLSCDNLPDNSKTAGISVIQLAKLIDPKLATWIEENLRFCNTMVDRIVPKVTASEIDALQTKIGVKDHAIVGCEPFKQWVIEDNFASDRPPWDKVGAQFVNDVSEYEKMKLRLLNCSHSALAYLGKLMDLEYIYQAVENPQLSTFIDELMKDMEQTLAPIQGIDLSTYKATVKNRFANARIPYTTQQVATDGSQKIPQRLLTPMLELLAKGMCSKPFCLVLAAWLRYLKGSSYSQQKYQVNDPLANTLVPIAQDDSLTATGKLLRIAKVSGVIPTALIEHEEAMDSVSVYLELFEQSTVSKVLSQNK